MVCGLSIRSGVPSGHYLSNAIRGEGGLLLGSVD